jgi:hypothetical protein
VCLSSHTKRNTLCIISYNYHMYLPKRNTLCNLSYNLDTDHNLVVYTDHKPQKTHCGSNNMCIRRSMLLTIIVADISKNKHRDSSEEITKGCQVRDSWKPLSICKLLLQ